MIHSPGLLTTNVENDIKWIEGLRGIAAFVVVTGHVTAALWPVLTSPTQSYHGSSLFLQLPFIRLVYAGRVSIAVFALIAGYVNAIKPITFMRAQENDKALSRIASSAFKRTGRLVLPTTVATVIAWFLTQIGGFEVALHAHQPWIREISPQRSTSVSHALRSLLKNLVTTWTTGANEYDKIQWTITYFLQAALWTYMLLVAINYVKSKYRLLIYAGLYSYFWCANNSLVGINICFGIFVADFAQSLAIKEFTKKWRGLVAVASSCMILLGLYLCSFPETNYEWAHWSEGIATISNIIIPHDGELSRYVHSVGAQFLILGIEFSGIAKKALSSRTLGWMGKNSFAVYLIHPLFIRTVLVWLMYGTVKLPQDIDGVGHPLKPGILIWHKGYGSTFAALSAFYLTLYVASEYWSTYVESWCSRCLLGVENLMFTTQSPVNKKNLMFTNPGKRKNLLPR